MSLFKIIGKIATAPLTIAADVITMGGVLSDRRKPYTQSLLEDIGDEIDDSLDN